jgi:predicted HTH transcriptional regulator
MNQQDIRQYIEAGSENRNLEYKTSVSWEDSDIKRKLVKSILGMANTKDGGTIVIGMEEQKNKSYLAKGISEKHKLTFNNKEEIKEFVSNYADPYVEFDVTIEEYDGNSFVFINIAEFNELPVMCKKPYPEILRRGAIYIRSKRGKPETIEVPTEVEMREIIEMAVDKGNIKLIKRGYQTSGKRSDEQLYEAELKDLD